MSNDKYGIRLSWNDFKSMLDNGSPFREQTLPGSVRLIIQDGDTKYQTVIHTDGHMPSEYTDYQTNYEANKNKQLMPKDSDGSPLSRIKTTKSGWSFQYHAVEITTGLEDGYHNHKIDPSTLIKSNLGFCSMKFYDK